MILKYTSAFLLYMANTFKYKIDFIYTCAEPEFNQLPVFFSDSFCAQFWMSWKFHSSGHRQIKNLSYPQCEMIQKQRTTKD